MAAPKGNQFWKIRSTHGREKLFSTPQLLEEAAKEYFNWVDSHPLYKVEAIKSGDKCGELIKIPIMRPYTLEGFITYVGASKEWWRDFKAAKHLDFSGVIEWIENTMYDQKLSGAAAGLLNGNIISRVLGLRDAQDHRLSGPNGEPLIPPAITHNVVFKRSDGSQRD